MVTTDDELEYLRRLTAILEKNQAKQTPSRRKIFREIEEAVAPLGGLMRLAGQVNDLVEHGNSRSLSEEMSLRYHPLAYRLATHKRLTKKEQSARAKKPRERRHNQLKEAVVEILQEAPGLNIAEVLYRLEKDHKGVGQLLEQVTANDVTLNESGRSVKVKTIENWLPKLRVK